jgi:plastocyanin
VGIRKRLLTCLGVLLSATLVIMPAVAGSETSPQIEAVNSTGLYTEQTHAWSPKQVAVPEGASVTISNHTAVAHGVHWVGGPATPVCSPGIPVGTSAAASAPEWSGTCTFTRPGTYTFYCTVHGPEMTGSVTVAANGTVTPVLMTQTPAAPTSALEPGGVGQPGSASPEQQGAPLAGVSARAVKLAASQHGNSVRGSVHVSQSGSRGRLEVDLLAGSASLASTHPAPTLIGRVVHAALSPGVVPFSVGLSSRAVRTLHRRHRLALTVQLILKPLHGSAVHVTRAVVMHP